MINRLYLGITSLALLAAFVACAGQKKNSELPPPDSAATEELYANEPAPTSTLDVDMTMDFEDEEEEDEEPRGAEPPPTQTYSPANKLEDQ
jgi:hypothetical protein